MIKSVLIKIKNKINSQSHKQNSDNDKTLEKFIDLFNQRIDVLQAQNHQQLLTGNILLDRKVLPYWKSRLLNDNKKKYLIAGYYGALNKGDELMLETILEYIDEKVDFYIMLFPNDKILPSLLYKNKKYVYYPKDNDELEMLADSFEGIFFGGGAHLDDRFYSTTDENYGFPSIYIKLSQLFIKKGKKVITYGFSSIANFKNKDYLRDLKDIVNYSTYFSVRDNLSSAILKDSLDLDNINIVDDIALANKSIDNVKNIKEQDSILCVLVYNEKTYVNNLILIKELLKSKKKVILLPFYEYNNNDSQYIDKIINEINDKNLIKHAYPETSDDLIKEFLSSNKIISSRYHATLMALILNKNVLSLTYDKHPHYITKINGIYSMYNLDKKEIYLSKINNQLESLNIWLESTERNVFPKQKLLVARENLNKQIGNLIYEEE